MVNDYARTLRVTITRHENRIAELETLSKIALSENETLRDENTRLQNEIADLRGENAMLRSTKTNDIGVWRDKWKEQNASIYELERTIDAMRADLQRVKSELKNTLSLLGDVMRLFAAGAGTWSDEYKIALQLIGVVPVGDISTPEGE